MKLPITCIALSSANSCLDFGPGISVFTVGPFGSPATKVDAALNVYVTWTDPSKKIILHNSVPWDKTDPMVSATM
jgi:hypothetical protein